ncbi:Hint domain-containing protein [Marimonas lutisalis]|uniref:Hint domain-containing protein n=1 Tax=Marimonas lutisalis TaxID=2545756 RepID=UPI001F2B1A38|nr:Hint domain-containing protein [Marimonas lutisalis]
MPSWGNFSFDGNTGGFSFTFTADAFVANGGEQVISFDVIGANTFLGYDLDSVAFDISCFAEGTRIATPGQEVAVEDLAIGDLVETASGRAVPVKWIGRQTIATRFGPAERLMPVRIRAGALGDGLPYRDLTLTADHALFIDGLLITAGTLVNGTSIYRVPLSELGDSETVFHVETENHDLILAEGTAAETYIDHTDRTAFDNFQEYLDLYGETRTIPELAYPRISTSRLLPRAIAERLGVAGAATYRAVG